MKDVDTGMLNITDQKKTKAQLIDEIEQLRNQIYGAPENQEKTRTSLRQTQMMQAIGILAGGIAHELNNILTPIMIHAEIALLDLPDDSPLCSNMEGILAASDRARYLVSQFLAFSQQEENEPQSLAMTPLVKASLKFLRLTMPATISIHQELNAQNDVVLADPGQINQVLMNLCTNAVDAMQERGGMLTVGLENVTIKKGAVPTSPQLVPGPYIKLTVKDTGTGIDPVIVDRAFSTQFAADERKQGAGLGLAAVWGIINDCRGGIAVDSSRGEGTLVSAYFPKAEEKRQAAEFPLPIPGGSESLLLVDDDSGLVSSMESALEKLGYTVSAHVDSLEALESFKSGPARFDLVITDQVMPNLTGQDLSEQMLAIRSDIPIILCTAHSETIDEKKAKSLGIRDYMLKPLVLHKLAVVIRSVLDG